MLNEALTSRLLEHSKADLCRQRFAIERRQDKYIYIEGQRLLNFCGSDYLGMSLHPEVKKAFIEGVERYGFGSSASALIAGFYTPQLKLEEAFAEFLKREKAILFNSGYHANLGTIGMLAKEHKTIIWDRLCHASLIDGIKLSAAKHYRYAHHNLIQLKELLNKEAPALIITEGVFSMEGDISPLPQIAELAKTYHSTLLVDDAHGIGVLGNNGAGSCEFYALKAAAVPCLITPLGKAFGSMGALVSGSENLIDALMQFARTYMFSTALPPAIAFATLTVLNILQKETWRIEKLKYLIHYFIKEANARSLSLISTDITPIKCLLIKNNQRALDIKNILQQKGFFISCIRPPSVPKNTARIRISLNCLHEEEDITSLLDNILECLC